MRIFHISIRTILTIAIAAQGLNACVSDRLQTILPKSTLERAIGADTQESVAYKLMPGDRIRVTIFDLTAETNEYVIDQTGAIAVPPLSPQTIKGLTTEEAANTIAKGFISAGLVRTPRITVDTLAFGPIYVLGEINKPGEFLYRPGMSLFAAIATAGGYTYRANKSRVFIRRAEDQFETEYVLSSDITILPGDVIRIPEIHI